MADVLVQVPLCVLATYYPDAFHEDSAVSFQLPSSRQQDNLSAVCSQSATDLLPPSLIQNVYALDYLFCLLLFYVLITSKVISGWALPTWVS